MRCKVHNNKTLIHMVKLWILAGYLWMLELPRAAKLKGEDSELQHAGQRWPHLIICEYKLNADNVFFSIRDFMHIDE